MANDRFSYFAWPLCSGIYSRPNVGYKANVEPPNVNRNTFPMFHFFPLHPIFSRTNTFAYIMNAVDALLRHSFQLLFSMILTA